MFIVVSSPEGTVSRQVPEDGSESNGGEDVAFVAVLGEVRSSGLRT